MLNRQTILGLIAASHLLLAPAAIAATTYQVTGPILELTDKFIVVQKGDERWSIARDENTKANSSLKVGEKVTIHYRMTATSVDVKSPGAEPKKRTK
jgi:hypothetical protein